MENSRQDGEGLVAASELKFEEFATEFKISKGWQWKNRPAKARFTLERYGARYRMVRHLISEGGKSSRRSLLYQKALLARIGSDIFLLGLTGDYSIVIMTDRFKPVNVIYNNDEDFRLFSELSSVINDRGMYVGKKK